MTIFSVAEKQQKSHFSLQIFYWNLRYKPKSQHSQQNSVLVLAKQWIFLLLSVARAELQPLVLVHTDLASIFNITTALHAGK